MCKCFSVDRRVCPSCTSFPPSYDMPSRESTLAFTVRHYRRFMLLPCCSGVLDCYISILAIRNGLRLWSQLS